MKKLTAVIIIIVFYTSAFAQSLAVKKGAQEMAAYALKGDYPQALAYIYPKVVTLWGGRSYILKNSKMAVDKLQSSGVNIKSIYTGNPGKVQTYGQREYSIVNQTVLLNAGGAASSGRVSVLAVSENKGVKWYFIIAGTISNKALYKLFPEIEGRILLPKPEFPGIAAIAGH